MANTETDTITFTVSKEDASVLIEALADHRQKGLLHLQKADEKKHPEVYERIRYSMEKAALLGKRILEMIS